MTEVQNAELLNELLRKMDEIMEIFRKTKAHIGFQNNNSIGSPATSTAPIYQNDGFKHVSIYLKSSENDFKFYQLKNDDNKFIAISLNDLHKINEEDIRINNKITLLINQNFIVRLYSLMESHHVCSEKISIDNTLEGSEDLDLLRRLRNVFAHSSGCFDPDNDEHNIMFDRLITFCEWEIVDVDNWKKYYPNEFPLSIEKVCIPLFNRCKKYILELQNKLLLNS
jgi:hypothetical protein